MAALLDLREESLELADAELDAFVTQAAVDRRINRSVAAVYEMVIDGHPRAAMIQAIRQSTPNNPFVPLPIDYFQLMAVDVKSLSSSEYRDAYPLDLGRRNDFERATWGVYSEVYYLEQRDDKQEANLRIYPTPTDVSDFRIHYIPIAPILEFDSDNTLFAGAWDEWVVYDVAQWIATKQESEVGELVLKKNEIGERILRAARKRNRTGLRIRDVRGRFRNRGRFDDYGSGGWYP